jgi:hypothetical protein
MTSELVRLQAALEHQLAAAGLQPRDVFARLRASPAGSLRLEASDERAAEAGRRAAREVAGAGPIEIVVLPEAALRGRSAWTAASVAEVRREPRHASEQVSQALQGEVLEPLLHEDGWVLGRQADGYVGWVRDWHLRLVAPDAVRAFHERCTARVLSTWSAVHVEPRADAEVCAETVLGTAVEVRQRRSGWAEVELPAGRCGWLPETALRPGLQAWPRDAAAIVATLRRFGGVPYLWGGRSPKGFDCSGLVQFVFGLHGLALPRDSDQQARCGVAVDDPRCGDLLFFGSERVTHVAVAVDGADFLHARGEVRCNSLAPDRPRHDPELRALYRGARRVLDHTT